MTLSASLQTPENAPWKLTAESLRVIDGDTQVYLAEQEINWPNETIVACREFIVRLLETNTPERGQEGFEQANFYVRNFLYWGGELATPKPVDLRLTGRRDVYGRWLGWALVDGVNLSYALNREGWGMWRPITVHTLQKGIYEE